MLWYPTPLPYFLYFFYILYFSVAFFVLFIFHSVNLPHFRTSPYSSCWTCIKRKRDIFVYSVFTDNKRQHIKNPSNCVVLGVSFPGLWIYKSSLLLLFSCLFLHLSPSVSEISFHFFLFLEIQYLEL